MSNIEEIKDRIRKLLATAGNAGATEGEIENAVKFAGAMLAKYQLSETDLEQGRKDEKFAEVESAPMGRQYCYIGTKCFRWEQDLATFVKELVGGVGVYLDPSVQVARVNGIAQYDASGRVKRGKRYCFYGATEDVELAAEIFDSLRLTIASMGRLRFGGCYKGDGGMYCEGFTAGLYGQLKQPASPSNSTALIAARGDLVRRKQWHAKRWLAKEHGIRLRTGTGRNGANGSTSAFNEGKADGSNTSVSAKRTRKLN